MRRTTGLGHDLATAAAPPRRWPWALAATVVGAAAGAAVAYAVRGGWWADRPGAVDPDHLEAVVDRPSDAGHDEG